MFSLPMCIPEALYLPTASRSDTFSNVLAVNAAIRSRRWKQFALMTLVCLLCILPWTARNLHVLGKFIPVRSNFWAEVYFGNVDFSVHPVGNSMLYQHEGELRFVAELKQGALNLVRSNPGTFVRRSGERIVSFWVQPQYLLPYPLLLFLVSWGGIVQAKRRGKLAGICVGAAAVPAYLLHHLYFFALSLPD